MPLHSIYALCEPGTLTVRYVGRTKHAVMKRVKEHCEKARSFPERPVEEWIAQLGKQPDYIELATCPPDLSREVEKAWILLFIDNGCNMLNTRDCDRRGAKEKRRPDPCDDPVYYRALVDRLIAEEAALDAPSRPTQRQDAQP